MLAVINKLGKELLTHDWEELRKEETFTSDGTGSYVIGTDILTDGDYEHFVSDTLWDRSNNRRISIVNAEEWATLKSGIIAQTGIVRYARIRGNNFIMTPDDTGNTIASEYISKFWVESSGGTAQATFLADTDVSKLPEHLIELGAIAKLKQQKGLPSVVDQDNYERERERLIGGQMPLETLGDQDRDTFVLNVPDTGIGI